jgi:hypothetical protein
MCLESFWQFQCRHLHPFETVGLLAYLTEEVGMLVIIVFVAMAVA